MEHSRGELTAKLKEMYPEIEKHQIDLTLEFNVEKNAWIVHFRKDGHELATHLEKDDAAACLEGRECVHLGVQFAQFLKNFEAEEPGG